MDGEEATAVADISRARFLQLVESCAFALPAVVSALAGAAALAGAPAAASAATGGSLTLVCTSEQDGTPVTLSGDTYALARVATAALTWAGGTPQIDYAAAPGFESLSYNWTALDASAWRRATHEAADIAQAGDLLTVGTASANAQGRVSFGWLTAGLYLALRTAVAPGNEGYTCDPVLVSVPALEDGVLVYDVVADLKFEWDEAPVPPEEEPPAEENPPQNPVDNLLESLGLPHTGDPAFALGTGLLAGGAALAAVGARRRRSAEAAAEEATAEEAAAEEAAASDAGAGTDLDVTSGAAPDVAPGAAPDDAPSTDPEEALGAASDAEHPAE